MCYFVDWFCVVVCERCCELAFAAVGWTNAPLSFIPLYLAQLDVTTVFSFVMSFMRVRDLWPVHVYGFAMGYERCAAWLFVHLCACASTTGFYMERRKSYGPVA